MQFEKYVLKPLQARLPTRSDTLKVFNVVLFAVFGWSIRGFLFKIPAFTLYYGLKTNLAILSYMLAFALFESLLVTGCLLALCILLPSTWLKEGFGYKGFLIVLVASTALILFQGYFQVEFFKNFVVNDYSPAAPVIVGALVSLVVLVGLIWLFQHWPRVRKYLDLVVEQFEVFGYIYVPLGLLGLIVVIIRNL